MHKQGIQNKVNETNIKSVTFIWRNDRKTVVIPSGRMSGKFNWTKVSREFNAPADGSVGMGFTLYGGGTVNFDHVVLQEVTE